MPIVIRKPELRFERKYKNRLTVLEGAELSCLMDKFFQRFRRIKKSDSFEKELLLSVCHAYFGLYGRDVVSDEALKSLSTADARKMDLFYKGMLAIITETLYPKSKHSNKLPKNAFSKGFN